MPNSALSNRQLSLAARRPGAATANVSSTVYYLLQGFDDAVAIPVGAFADPHFPAPTFSVYEERMHSWVSMPPGIERMA